MPTCISESSWRRLSLGSDITDWQRNGAIRKCRSPDSQVPILVKPSHTDGTVSHRLGHQSRISAGIGHHELRRTVSKGVDHHARLSMLIDPSNACTTIRIAFGNQPGLIFTVYHNNLSTSKLSAFDIGRRTRKTENAHSEYCSERQGVPQPLPLQTCSQFCNLQANGSLTLRPQQRDLMSIHVSVSRSPGMEARSPHYAPACPIRKAKSAT